MRPNWKKGENHDRRRNRILGTLLPYDKFGVFKEEMQLSGWFCFSSANGNPEAFVVGQGAFQVSSYRSCRSRHLTGQNTHMIQGANALSSKPLP